MLQTPFDLQCASSMIMQAMRRAIKQGRLEDAQRLLKQWEGINGNVDRSVNNRRTD